MIDLYTLALFSHILLYVFWLGGDLGVAVLGGQFRKRDDYRAPRFLTCFVFFCAVV